MPLMNIYNASWFSLYFGNKSQGIVHPYTVDKNANDRVLVNVKNFINVSQIIFLNQIHSADGYIITQDNIKIKPFSVDGDFLITQQKFLGLGVATADCLPIIIVDNNNQVIGIAHAGWRGSVNKIILVMLEKMQKIFNSSVSNLEVFFGPCIQSCCYEVQENFVTHITSLGFSSVITCRNDKMYCDLVFLNTLLLRSIGIQEKSFNYTFNLCTACDNRYHSYRRDGVLAGRNISIISII